MSEASKPKATRQIMASSSALFPALVVAVVVGLPQDLVGRWDGKVSGLPDPKLPDVPLAGNGYFGAALTHTADGSGVDIWLGSNAMWACVACDTDANGCCKRVSLGRITIEARNGSFTSASAEQYIANGTLVARVTTNAGDALTFAAQMHPKKNILSVNATYESKGRVAGLDALALDLVITTSVGNSTDASPANCTCIRGVGAGPGLCPPGSGLLLSRRSNGEGVGMRVWSALVTTLRGEGYPGPTNFVESSSNSSIVSSWTLPPGGSLRVVTTMADNTLSGPGGGDPSLDAIKLAADPAATAPGAVSIAANKWWSSYWSLATISLPNHAGIERFWYGSQYFLACSASTDARVPPPGLYGPWVFTDDPAWHGDYTLDYNQEATFYGAFSSNRVAHTSSYYAPITSWSPAARLAAVKEGAAARIEGGCPPEAQHFACHIAPWGYQSQDQTVYMHWNGNFASLLFINHWEYTRNVTFAKRNTVPLLEGIAAWWTCYLSSDGSGGYEDWNVYSPDDEHEGQKRRDPQIGLALIARLYAAVIDIAEAVGVAPPKGAIERLEGLVPFNSAPLPLRRDVTVWTASRNDTVESSDYFALYPLFPSEYQTLNASSDARRIAQATSKFYSNFAKGRPVELFPAAVRAGYDASNDYANSPSDIISGLQAYLGNFQTRRMLPYAPGGGVENIGVTRAVNEMLIAAPDGKYIDLFPMWPSDAPAEFADLRVKGAFLVSARRDAGGDVQGLVVAAAGPGGAQSARVRCPWSSGSTMAARSNVTVSCAGGAGEYAPQVEWERDVAGGDAMSWFFTFEVRESGHRCSVSRE